MTRSHQKGAARFLLAGLLLAAVPAMPALPATAATLPDKLTAIAGLLRDGTPAASQTLRAMATSDPDLQVREQAILALAQIGGEDSIPALTEIAAAPPSPAVRQAALSAAYDLRQRFPFQDAPKVTLKAVTPLATGRDFTVEATVVSAVDRPHARIQLAANPALRPVREAGAPLPGYQGPLKAGQTVTLRATYRADQSGPAELRLAVRISQNAVDASSYETPLYLDLQEGSGTASLTPPSGKTARRAD